MMLNRNFLSILLVWFSLLGWSTISHAAEGDPKVTTPPLCTSLMSNLQCAVKTYDVCTSDNKDKHSECEGFVKPLCSPSLSVDACEMETYNVCTSNKAKEFQECKGYVPPICSPFMGEDQCQERMENVCKSSLIPSHHQRECNIYNKILEEAGKEGPANPNAPSDDNVPTTGGTGPLGGGMIKNAGTAAQLMFSPSSFAAQQSMGFIESFFRCKSEMSEEEKSLALRRGAKLCANVGTYCSKKVKVGFIKLCRTKKTTYCCFNSTLARIINVEGRKQLGYESGWGSAQEPNCSGFTLEEFNKIDIGKMDLTEFVNEVTQKANASTSTARSKDYWEDRNSSRLNDSLSSTRSTENLAQEILTSDDPYKLFSQDTDGTDRVNQELANRNPRDKVKGEDINSPSIKNPQAVKEGEKISQDDINEGNRQYKNWINSKK